MPNDSRGQISAEFVLMIGLIVVLVIAVAQYIGPNLEENEVMSAAKIACINASNDIAYTTGNVIRFNNMTLNNGTITVSVYSKIALNATNINYMQNKILNNIAQTLGTNIANNTVKGRYSYSVNVINVT